MYTVAWFPWSVEGSGYNLASGKTRRCWHSAICRSQSSADQPSALAVGKSILGAGLKARDSYAQTREAVTGCHILNRMAELGRPQSYAVRL